MRFSFDGIIFFDAQFVGILVWSLDVPVLLVKRFSNIGCWASSTRSNFNYYIGRLPVYRSQNSDEISLWILLKPIWFFFHGFFGN